MSLRSKLAKITTWASSSEPQPLLDIPENPLVMSPVARQGGYLKQLGFDDVSLNEFDKLDRAAKDDRVWAILELIGLLTKKSYNGIGIKGTNENDTELDEREKAILKTSQDFAKNLKLNDLFYSYSKLLFKHGDVIEKIVFGRKRASPVGEIEADGKGIVNLIPLPRNQITAIDTKDQMLSRGIQTINNSTHVVQQANFYILDEKNKIQNSKDPVVYNKNQIFRIAFDSRSNWKKDLVGRSTFNVWSNAPLEVIMYLIEWKHNLVRNDMLWKDRLLPREYYSLDMSLYIPENYDGDTQDERVEQARVAAQTAIDKFAQAAKQKQADQGVVLPDSVTYTIVEPKSTNYHDPNDMIDQIDVKISSVIGVPNALLGGESKGFTSLVHSASFLALRIEIYGEKIAQSWEELNKKHLKLVHPSFDDELFDKVFVKRQLILDRDLLERAKVASTAAGTMALTLNELRNIMGKDPLTDDQFKKHLEYLEKTGQLTSAPGKSVESTTDDVNKAEIESPTGDQKSDEKKKNDETGGTKGE